MPRSGIEGAQAERSNSLKHLTEDELLDVFETARRRSSRDHALLIVCFQHALRASELVSLRLGDIDWRNMEITIRRLKGSLKTTQPLFRMRGRPCMDEVSALRTWLNERPRDSGDLLFLSQKGGRLDRSQFFRLFQSIAAAAGLPAEKRHPHALKHSIASHLVSENVNLALVKQQLGHKSIGSTMRYVTTSDQQASKAATSALMRLY